jgi:hypothetical protein
MVKDGKVEEEAPCAIAASATPDPATADRFHRQVCPDLAINLAAVKILQYILH